MRSFQRIIGVLTLSVLTAACSLTDDGGAPNSPKPTAPAPGGDGKKADEGAPVKGEPIVVENPPVTGGGGATPVEVSQLSGTWDYDAVIANNQMFPAVGTLVLNSDGSFVDEVSVNGGEVVKTTGTFSVKQNEISVKYSDGDQNSFTYQFGEAEKNGVKKPALILHLTNGNQVILVRRTEQAVQPLVGTWDYMALMANGKQYSASGTLILNADGTFAEDVSVEGQPAVKSNGTYVVNGNLINVTSDGKTSTLSYELGTAEKDGEQKPALIVKSDKVTYVLVKKQ